MKFDLSKKEKEICKFILDSSGRVSRTEMAKHFNISRTTAAAHINNIYVKLAVNSKSELVYKILTDERILK